MRLCRRRFYALLAGAEMEEGRKTCHQCCARHGWDWDAPNVDHIWCEHRDPHLAWLQSVGPNASPPPDATQFVLPAPRAPAGTPDTGPPPLPAAPTPPSSARVAAEALDGALGEAGALRYLGAAREAASEGPEVSTSIVA
ncbi:hypothetical protein N9L68_05165 [bacterium]|nr:hypothetical protein [bacterium]